MSNTRRDRLYAEDLVEKHHRQGREFTEFLKFQRGLSESQKTLSQREQFMLFLEHNKHRSEEDMEYYRLVMEYERPYLERQEGQLSMSPADLNSDSAMRESHQDANDSN